MPKKNSRNTKSKIVSAAWKLFYDNGYENTTIEDIIFESGTSKGSFYHYFESKDALLGSLAYLFDEKYEQLEDEIMVTVIATGFDSEYYRDDPRAAELFRPGGARLTDESEEAPAQPVEEQIEAEEEQQPVIENNAPAANSDFASANTSNIWSSIPSANDDDDSDIPAILRRRRKNRD